MTSSPETLLQSFVLLRLGERRFALPASQVAELVAPSRIFRFPHKSCALEGVILRRGRMIAVCDIAEQLTGKKLDTRRFNLLATRKYGHQLDWIAIPVSGECELITVDMMSSHSPLTGMAIQSSWWPYLRVARRLKRRVSSFLPVSCSAMSQTAIIRPRRRITPSSAQDL